jgi:hypothetical protein
MKRIVVLTLTIMFLFTATCFADSERWQLIYKIDSESASFLLDSYTHELHIKGNKRYIYCWLKSQYPDGYIMDHIRIALEDLRYQDEEYIFYDNDDNEVGRETSDEWKTPIPRSNMEIILQEIMIWMKNNLENNPPKVKYY